MSERMTAPMTSRTARLARLAALFDDDEGLYENVIVDIAEGQWILTELLSYRAELERIAACEPAHRARIQAVLDGEVGE